MSSIIIISKLVESVVRIEYTNGCMYRAGIIGPENDRCIRRHEFRQDLAARAAGADRIISVGSGNCDGGKLPVSRGYRRVDCAAFCAIRQSK